MCTLHVSRPSSVNDNTRRRRRDTVDNCLNNVCHSDAGCFSLTDEVYYCKCKTGFRGDGVSYCKQWDEELPVVADPDLTDGSNSLEAPVTSKPSATDDPLTKVLVASSVPIAPVPSDTFGLPPSFFADDDVSGSPTAPSDAPVAPVAKAPFPVASIFPIAPIPFDPPGLPPSFFAEDDVSESPTAPSAAPVALKSDEFSSIPPAWLVMLQNSDSPNSDSTPTAAPTRVIPPPSGAPHRHTAPKGQRTVINDSHVLKGPLL